MDPAQCGGSILDLHIHDVDYVNFLFGKPATISAAGVCDDKGGVGQVNAIYTYDDGKMVTLDGGWISQPTFQFRIAFRILLEEATLEFNSPQDMNLYVHTASSDELVPALAEGDGYSREHQYFLECVESGQQPTIVTAESSLEAISLVEQERAIIG